MYPNSGWGVWIPLDAASEPKSETWSTETPPSGLCCCLQSLGLTFCEPLTAAHQASPSLPVSWSLPMFMSVESVMPSNHLILYRPFLLLPLVFPSIRVFFSESVLCIRGPKYWSFIFSISPSNEYSGLISFRVDRFDLLNH